MGDFDWSTAKKLGSDGKPEAASEPSFDWSTAKQVETKPRSALGEIGTGLKKGIVSDLPSMAGQALQYISNPGNAAYEYGKGIVDRADARGELPENQLHPEDHNVVTNALASGAEMIPQSIAPTLAVGGTLAAIPGLPAAAIIGGGAILGAIPAGMSQGQQTLDKADKLGISRDVSIPAARKTAAIETGGEALGTLALGPLAGVGEKTLFKTIGKAAENPAKKALENATSTSVLKPWLKGVGETALEETATEIAQNAGEAQVEKNAGIDTQSAYDAGVQAIAPTLGMTALMAPFGLVGHGIKAKRNSERAATLSGADAKPEDRLKAAADIFGEIHEADPVAAANFADHANGAIKNGQPLTLDESLFQPYQEPVQPSIAGALAAPKIVPDIDPLAAAQEQAASEAANQNAAKIYADRAEEEQRRQLATDSFGLEVGHLPAEHVTLQTKAGKELPEFLPPTTDGMVVGYPKSENITLGEQLAHDAQLPDAGPLTKAIGNNIQALPGPDTLAPAGGISVDAEGNARPVTYAEHASNQQARQDADAISGRVTGIKSKVPESKEAGQNKKAAIALPTTQANAEKVQALLAKKGIVADIVPHPNKPGKVMVLPRADQTQNGKGSEVAAINSPIVGDKKSNKTETSKQVITNAQTNEGTQQAPAQEAGAAVPKAGVAQEATNENAPVSAGSDASGRTDAARSGGSERNAPLAGESQPANSADSSAAIPGVPESSAVPKGEPEQPVALTYKTKLAAGVARAKAGQKETHKIVPTENGQFTLAAKSTEKSNEVQSQNANQNDGQASGSNEAATNAGTNDAGTAKEGGTTANESGTGHVQETSASSQENGTQEGSAVNRDDVKKGQAEGFGDSTTRQEAPDLQMQNRDRTRAASVLQMKSIAENPDAERLGVSPTPDTGAPMVSVAGNKETIPAADMGKKKNVTFADGRKVPVHYAVVEADGVLASNKVDGTKNSVYYDAKKDGEIRALTNGRVAGLQAAHAEGKAKAYVDGLVASSDEHGVSEAAIRSKKNPILVRVYDDAVNNDENIGRASNAQAGLGYSASETANNDARILDVAGLTVAEDGSITAASNMDFLRKFVRAIPKNEQASLLDPEGRPTKQLMDRIKAALFAKAYNEPSLLSAMAEESDPDVKNLLNALNIAAPEFAKLDNAGKLEIRPQIAAAVTLIRDAKARGLSIGDALSQNDMFGRDPMVESLAKFFSENIRSPRRIGSGLAEAAKFIQTEIEAEKTADMFGRQPSNLDGVIDRVNAYLREQYGDQAKTIENPTGRSPAINGASGVNAPSRESEEGAGTQVEGTAAPALELQSQTEASRLAEEQALKKKQDEKAATRRAAEDKAQADNDAKDFTLTGSNRPADVAMAGGQGDLLTQPKQAETVAAKQEFQTDDGTEATLTITRPGGIKGSTNPNDIEKFRLTLSLKKGSVVSPLKIVGYYDTREEAQKALDGEKARLLPDSTQGSDSTLAGQLAANTKPVDEKSIKTDDVGEELWYNRRNINGRGISWNDISGLNDTLKVQEAVKAKVWIRPDYDEMVQDGIHPVTAHLVKQIYDSIATKPQTAKAPTDEQIKEYIETVQRVKDAVFTWAKNRNAQIGHLDVALSKVGQYSKSIEAEKVLGNTVDTSTGYKGRALLEAIFPPPIGGEKTRYSSIFRGDSQQAKDNNRQARLIGNKAIDAIQSDYQNYEKALSAVKDGWPAKQEAWQKSFEIHEMKAGTSMTRNGAKVTLDKDEFFITKKGGRSIRASGFFTRAEAIEGARQMASRTQKTDGAKSEQTVALDRKVRTGPERRAPGEDISTEKLKSTFGFRGINFGNWMKGDSAAIKAERQAHVNHAFDAFTDLAEIMGVPPEAMSLNGTLGVAIGAQGSGGKRAAAAHFVPGANEINLTREQGAGSLAHEWAHALDHYFAVQSGPSLAKNKKPFLTEHLERPQSDAGIRPEIVSAFRDIVSATLKRSQTPEEKVARDAFAQESSAKKLVSWLNHFRRDLEARAKPEEKERALKDFDQIVERLNRGDIGEGIVNPVRGLHIGATVNEIRTLFKDAAGGVPNPKELQSLNTWTRIVSDGLKVPESDTAHVPQEVSVASNYLHEANKLEGASEKKYWSTKLEMFARAFQSYVIDKLERTAGRNDYLSRPQMSPEALKVAQEMGVGESGDRYPRGAEREKINSAFDKLVSDIKTKETDEGTAMFRLGDQSENGFYSELTDSVQAIKNNKAIGSIWKNIIKNLAQKGVKNEEIEWSGVNEWLDQQAGAVTKQQVVDYLRSQEVQIKEVTKGESKSKESVMQGQPMFKGAVKSDTAVKNGLDPKAVFKELTDALGERGIKSLVSNGVLKVLPNRSYLPKNLLDQINKRNTVTLGLYDPNTHTAYIIADEIEAGEAVKVLLHEVGEHYGLKNMLGAAGYSRLLNNVRTMKSMGNRPINEAWAQVARNYKHLEEGGDRFVREVVAHLSEQPEALKLPFFKRMIQAIRQFLWQHGFKAMSGKLSDADVVGMVVASLRKTMSAPIRQKQSPIGEAAMAKQVEDVDFRLADTLPPQIREKIGDLMNTTQTLNGWWHKTVVTQHHKAQIDKDFKRVFDAGQNYLHDVSRIANEAADLAPDLLPRIERMADLRKMGASAKDVQAISAAIFKGTLAKEKYTAAELVSKYNLNPKQIKLYNEFRAATDKSLDDLARSEFANLVRKKGIDAAVKQAKGVKSMEQASEIIAKAIEEKGDEKLAQDIRDKAKKISKLKSEGYAPLMRFGKHSVYITGKDSEGKTTQLYFGLYETKREANKAGREMMAAFSDDKTATMTRGTISEQAYKLFANMNPETLELFAEALGASEKEIVQEYLRKAKNNHSAIKRLIERKGVAGFSEDAKRVLASFITSNARASAVNLHMGEMAEATEAIPQTKGDVKDEAVDLLEYLRNPREEAQALRGFLFFNFLGGSIASAAVNLTQPVMMSFPYLARWGTGKAAAALTKGAAYAAKPMVSTPVTPLDRAMAQAINEGIVAPQEIHQLNAQAAGRFAGASLALQKMMTVWGSMFSLAEQFNRKMTFAAAFNMAQDMGQEKLREAGFTNAYDFAAKSVHETQGIYNRGNRPDWARGALGATLFTFKQYSVSYVEFLKRLPLQQRMLALGIMFLASGLNGIPFADDLDDLIDTIAQALGFNFNTKEKKRQFIAKAIGQAGGNFVLNGVSAIPGVPLDVQGRLGMSNLIPGTGVFKRSTSDKGREMAEAVGPIGGVLDNVGKALGSLAKGDVTGALGNVAPVSVQNAIKAAQMASDGFYKDTKGRKVIDTTGGDAFTKAIGFQPQKVAQESRNIREQQQDISFVKDVQSTITDKIAQAYFDKDVEARQAAMQELRDWNASNPDAKILILPTSIQARVKQMMMSRQERFIKSAPKGMRKSVMENLSGEAQ
jgi:hypothetical protein